jgi:hypothetical protein
MQFDPIIRRDMSNQMVAIIEFMDGFGDFQVSVMAEETGLVTGIGNGETPEDAFSYALADWAKQTGKEIPS